MQGYSRPLILSRNAAVIALVTAVAFVLGIGLLSADTARRLAIADVEAHRAKLTLAATTQFLTALGLVEKAAAAYRRAPGNVSAGTLAFAERELAHELATLQSHFTSRPELRPLLDQLERSSRERDPDGAVTASSRAMMRLAVHALQRHEFSALAEFASDAADQARDIHHLIGAAVAMAILLGAAAAWLLLRRIRDDDRTVTVCAWTRRVLWKGCWISFEEYLAQRFDLRCTHGICDEAIETARKDIPPKEGPTPG